MGHMFEMLMPAGVYVGGGGGDIGAAIIVERSQCLR